MCVIKMVVLTDVLLVHNLWNKMWYRLLRLTKVEDLYAGMIQEWY